MYKGKPYQPDMSLREKQHMNLDSESGTHIGMEGQLRSSHKYLLLQVWCGLLTVAMVVMAALLISIKPKSTEDKVSTVKPDNNVSLTDGTLRDSFMSIGTSVSYIQLIKSPDNRSWQEQPKCPSCSLILQNDSIHCTKDSLYFIYAQVTFSKHPKKNQPKSVILKRNAVHGKRVKKLVEGTFPHTTEGSVWVAKIVSLTQGDSVSLDITDDFLTDSTFWGAYQLH